MKDQHEFGVPDYGLQWPDGRDFGTADDFAWLGDLDGDGVGEMALDFAARPFPDGDPEAGGIAIAFLRPDGSVRKHLRISEHHGGLDTLGPDSEFGFSLASLGDLDGDGSLELAVGAPKEVSTGLGRTGGVWILSLDPSASRNGSGVNPLTLSEAADPVFGTNWLTTLDCSGHASGQAFLWGYGRPLAGTPSAFGEVLVGGTRVFRRALAHLSGPTPISTAVPPFDLSFIDLPLFVQGLCTGAPGPQLSNALDVLVGR